MNRAVFLDRDGTIIVEKHYLHKPEEVEIFPGTGEALRRLQDAGYHLIVVTNQSGIGRGYYTLADAEKVNRHVATELAREGIRFTKKYIAPEAPDQPSRGRKPSPQFLFDARDEFDLDLSQSYFIGDKMVDMECGWNGGVKKSILVRTGYGAELAQKEPDKLARAVVVNGLPEAVEWILNQELTRTCANLSGA